MVLDSKSARYFLSNRTDDCIIESRLRLLFSQVFTTYVHAGDALTFTLIRENHPFYLTSLPPSCTLYKIIGQMHVAELGNDEVEGTRNQKQRYCILR